jgi:hypothetical protein
VANGAKVRPSVLDVLDRRPARLQPRRRTTTLNNRRQSDQKSEPELSLMEPNRAHAMIVNRFTSPRVTFRRATTPPRV